MLIQIVDNPGYGDDYKKVSRGLYIKNEIIDSYSPFAEKNIIIKR